MLTWCLLQRIFRSLQPIVQVTPSIYHAETLIHACELLLQYRCTQTLAVDIHPAARIGKGVLLDHGTGLVIGETAVVGNNVSILHNVTLGGGAHASS